MALPWAVKKFPRNAHHLDPGRCLFPRSFSGAGGRGEGGSSPSTESERWRGEEWGAWSPAPPVHPRLLQLGLTCQAWHQRQAPRRADAEWGMKTSIHDNIKSLAPDRETGLLPVRDIA